MCWTLICYRDGREVHRACYSIAQDASAEGERWVSCYFADRFEVRQG